MATITIKIESDELAREVLAHIGYLPSDDLPDLISIKRDEPEEPESTDAFSFVKTTSSRNALVEQQDKNVIVTPEPIDEGFGTTIAQTDDDTKDKKQIDVRTKAAVVRERCDYEEYLAYLAKEMLLHDDPDITDVLKQLRANEEHIEWVSKQLHVA